MMQSSRWMRRAGAVLVVAMGVAVCGCATPGGVRAADDVSMAPLPDAPGFTLLGPHGFTGRLAWADDAWRIRGTFDVPSSGYSVGNVQVVREKRGNHVIVALVPPGPGTPASNRPEKLTLEETELPGLPRRASLRVSVAMLGDSVFQ